MNHIYTHPVLPDPEDSSDRNVQLLIVKDMQILLLLPLLALRCRRQIIESRTPICLLEGRATLAGERKVYGPWMTCQIMECEVAQLGWFDAKILECLRRRVDFLIDALPFDLISRHCWPPQHLVEDVGHWLEDALRNVDVPPVLDDLPVDQLGNLRR